MAASPGPAVWGQVSAIASKLSQDLRCPICMDVMVEPAQLPCCHFYCWNCILKTLKDANIRCPLCKTIHKRRDLARSDLLGRIKDQFLALEALTAQQQGMLLPQLQAPTDSNLAATAAADATAPGATAAAAVASGAAMHTQGVPPARLPAVRRPPGGQKHGRITPRGRAQARLAETTTAAPINDPATGNVVHAPATHDAGEEQGTITNAGHAAVRPGTLRAAAATKRRPGDKTATAADMATGAPAARGDIMLGQAVSEAVDGRGSHTGVPVTSFRKPRTVAARKRRTPDPEISTSSEATEDSAGGGAARNAERGKGNRKMAAAAAAAAGVEVGEHAGTNGAEELAPLQPAVHATPTAAGSKARCRQPTPSTPADTHDATVPGGSVAAADPETAAAAAGVTGLTSPRVYGTVLVADSTPGGLTVARRVPLRHAPWACPACTLHNAFNARKCAACRQPRPRDAMLVTPGATLDTGDATLDTRPSGGAADQRVAAAPVPLQITPAPSSEPTKTTQQAAGVKRARSLSDAHLLAPPPAKHLAASAAPKSTAKPRHTASVPPKPTTSRLTSVSPADTPAPTPGPTPSALGKRGAHGAGAAGAGAVGGSGGARGGRSWAGASQWVVLGSGLSPEDHKALRRLATLSGCCVAQEWRSGVTHVVCGVDEEACARRTVKYLMGIAHGCWLVSPGWVQACLDSQCAVDPALYEIQGDHTGGKGGAAAGRANKVLGMRVLQGCNVLLAGPFASKDDMVALLKAQGASVLQRAPATPPSASVAPAQGNSKKRPSQEVTTAAAGSAGYVLVDVETCRAKKLKPGMVSASAVSAGMTLLSYKWLLECVGTQRVAPVEPYTMSD